MAKRLVTTIFLIAIIGIVVFYFLYVNGWYEFRRSTDTPKEFLNKTEVVKEKYRRDSMEILRQLKKELSHHEGFFYSKEFFEDTNIIIDTILYSPKLDKLAALVIVQNPTTRQIQPNQFKPYYYNGTSYLGGREADTIGVTWFQPHLINYTDKNELSSDLREECFRLLVFKDTTDRYALKYNLNDIRFWTSSIWEKREADLIRRKEFEEEKRLHPENIYEPPK
ncbi:hypothetical protein [Segetibacter koreensis]|uniref:hypothetical protein n=1 Tax=Segetibacter koreensis TaxID=398037 RepID=UPI00035D6E2C|nr:hypothetical protein [Segetibacter koreensis]